MSTAKTKITELIQQNLRLSLFWLWLIVATLVALPTIAITGGGLDFELSNVSPRELSGGRIEYDFKFNPSLDFYGGSEVVYQLETNAELPFSESRVERTVARLEERLNNIGVSDYEMYARNSEDRGEEIVLRLPRRPAQLQNVNFILENAGTVSFVRQVQPEAPQPGEEETFQPQGPETIPLPIDRSYLTRVSTVYGADTFGYGLALDFDEDRVPEILVTSFSDVNSDPNSQVLISLGQTPIAGQSAPVSSASRTGRMLMTTGVGNDELANNLVRDLILNPQLNERLVTAEITEITGRYDEVIDIVRFGSVLLLLATGAFLIYRRRDQGFVLWLNLAFSSVSIVAFAKAFNVEVTLISIIAYITALAIGMYYIDRGMRKLIKGEEANLEKQRLLFILSASIVIGVALNFTNIAGLVDFIGYFSLGMIAVTICGYFALPLTVSLLRSNR